jgi:hypothetical protein
MESVLPVSASAPTVRFHFFFDTFFFVLFFCLRFASILFFIFSTQLFFYILSQFVSKQISPSITWPDSKIVLRNDVRAIVTAMASVTTEFAFAVSDNFLLALLKLISFCFYFFIFACNAQCRQMSCIEARLVGICAVSPIVALAKMEFATIRQLSTLTSSRISRTTVARNRSVFATMDGSAPTV